MKPTERIYEGKEIDTLFGYIVIGKMNDGGHVLCTEVECTEDGIGSEQEHWLTLYDIAHRMKDVDGKNHKVIYYEEESEDEE